MKFSIKDFSSKCDQIQKKTADLVTFSGEIFNGKLHFFCAAERVNKQYLFAKGFISYLT